MRKLRSLLWFLILGGFILLVSGCTVGRSSSEAGDIDAFIPPPQEPAQIRIEPESQQINVEGLTTVEIRIENVLDLFGFDLIVGFDANILQVQDVDPDQEGAQIEPGDFLSSDFVPDNEADNATGDIFFSVTQTAPTQPVSGSGVLAIVTFRGVAEGTSQLTFTVTDLSTSAGQAIPVTTQPGQITVSTEAGTPVVGTTPTQTSTPETPTLTPTTEQVPPTPTATSEVIQPTATAVPEAAEPTATPTTQAMIAVTPTAGIQPVQPEGAPPVVADLPLLPEPPPGATLGFCFRVRHEYSLYELVKRIKIEKGIEVSPRHIDLANDLHPPGYIFPQQVLFIPSQMGRGPNFYLTQPGDTLEKIGEACYLPADFIAQVNYLEDILLTAELPANRVLEIPRPPFPPPSRHRYPSSVFPGPYY